MKFGLLERRQLQRGPLQLDYYDAARGSVPVVFQHGLCGSAQQTAEAFPDDADLRMLTLECRGHGSSPAGRVDDLSIACFADDVIAMIEVEGLAPVILGGISMGAAIALRIAVRRPDVVRALILARPAWVTDAAPTNMRPNLEVGELLAGTPTAGGRASFSQSATARSLAAEAPDNLASLFGFFDRQPHDMTSMLLRRISVDGPGISVDQVTAVAVPALVIGHGGDHIHPWGLASNLAAMLPASRLVEITPKSVNRTAHVDDMHTAMARFIWSIPA